MRSLHSGISVLNIAKVYMSSGICSVYSSIEFFFFFLSFFWYIFPSSCSLPKFVKFLPGHIQSTIQQHTQGDIYVKYWSFTYAQLPSLLSCQAHSSQLSSGDLFHHSARSLCILWLPSLNVVLGTVSPFREQGKYFDFTHWPFFISYVETLHYLCFFVLFFYFSQAYFT